MYRATWFPFARSKSSVSCALYFIFLQAEAKTSLLFLLFLFFSHHERLLHELVWLWFCSFTELLHQEHLGSELLWGIPSFNPLQYVDQDLVQPLPLSQQQEVFLTHDPNVMSTVQFDLLTHTPQNASDEAYSYSGTVAVMTQPQIPSIIVTPATPGTPLPPPPLAFISSAKRVKARSNRRRTAQQLPYATNLLNLYLAPARRQTRDNNNTSSQQKQ